MKTNPKNRGWLNPVSVSVFLVLLTISIVLCVMRLVNIPVLALFILFSGLLAVSIRIANQWERAVVLRMGKYKGLRGPGLF